MNTKEDIQEILAQKTIAIVGLSRDRNAMSATANRELKAKGYRTMAVNPNAETIDGEKCWPSLAALPETPGAVLVFTQPDQSAKVVAEAAERGIRRVWLQQGAQSDAAVSVCLEKRMSFVSGKCIMMFAPPVGSIHGVHRWFAKVFGQLPR
jgi:uncharacterized protein